VHDPVVRDLAQRIELVPLAEGSHGAPGVWPAEMLIECGAERHTLHTRPYKGSPSNPFTWAEACEKFQRYTASIVGPPQATAIIDAVGGLERATDMADVVRLVALA
jgi:2-methylcitrate dehydratase PrpD